LPLPSYMGDRFGLPADPNPPNTHCVIGQVETCQCTCEGPPRRGGGICLSDVGAHGGGEESLPAAAAAALRVPASVASRVAVPTAAIPRVARGGGGAQTSSLLPRWAPRVAPGGELGLKSSGCRRRSLRETETPRKKER
jgi:hypothetical protein